MTEKELEKKVVESFSRFNDIKVVLEPTSNIYSWLSRERKKGLQPDVVIEYGEKPFAVIEINRNNSNNLEHYIYKQFTAYQEQVSKLIRCYILKIDDSFYYYGVKDKKLSPLSYTEVIKKLIEALGKGEENASDKTELLISSIEKCVKEIITSENERDINNYKDLFKKKLEKGKLMKHGNILFLERQTEIKLMRSLLENESPNENGETLCRYTSAKGLFESLKSNTFRLNSIESMNDAYETRVIDAYDKLKDTKNSINESLFRGYIMCFSNVARKDKLYNWYMYGGQAKGVCLTINRRNVKRKTKNNDYVFAPVVYAKMKDGKTECHLLDFLNNLTNLKVGKENMFKFRLWHYWKYFFKYDFYEEEMETRLVYITAEHPISGWNELYEIPCYYIEKSFEKLPFDISAITLGPKCGDNDFAQEVFSKMSNLKNENIKKSDIKGYKG